MAYYTKPVNWVMVMTKTLYISGSMPPLHCGVGFYTNRLLDYLEPGFDLLTSQGLDTHKSASKTLYTPDWKIRRLIALVKVCKQGNYDIIHVQYPAKGYKRNLGINTLTHLVRLFTKSKVVVTLHEYHGSGLLGKTRNLITALPAHRIIVSNPYDLDSLPWILKRNAKIIPIGSNIIKANKNAGFYNELLKEAGFSKSKTSAVFFGFAFPNKGLETLIEAAEMGNFQVILLSDLNPVDSYQHELLEKIGKARKKSAKIYPAGYLDDKAVSAVLQEADCFVLPQPLPLTAKSGTAIAAALHRLPIISTAATKPELNLPYINNQNSILLKEMSPSKLSDAITALQSAKISNAELNKLAEYFSWEDIAAKHELLYKELV